MWLTIKHAVMILVVRFWQLIEPRFGCCETSDGGMTEEEILGLSSDEIVQIYFKHIDEIEPIWKSSPEGTMGDAVMEWLRKGNTP